MMFESPVWDPYSTEYAQHEDDCHASLDIVPQPRDRSINSISTERHSDFDKLLIAHSVQSTTLTRRKGTVTADELAKRWNISVEQGRHTIDCTTQLGVHDFTNTTTSRRMRNTNQQIKHWRLNAKVYTDTMFSGGIKSLQGYTFAQAYVTDFGWMTVYPMVSKADAHLTLDLLHHEYGIWSISYDHP
jgi:hypothetical protein